LELKEENQNTEIFPPNELEKYLSIVICQIWHNRSFQ